MAVLIEWLEKNKTHWGILREDGLTKLQVMTLSGKNISVSAKRFFLRHIVNEDPAEYIAALQKEADEVDAGLLHSELRGGGEYDLSDLTRLWYSRQEPGVREKAVLLSACLRGEKWFKADPSGRIRAATEEEILRRERDEERRLRARSALEDMVKLLRDCLESGQKACRKQPKTLQNIQDDLLDFLLQRHRLEHNPILKDALAALADEGRIGHEEAARRILQSLDSMPDPYSLFMAKFSSAFIPGDESPEYSFQPLCSRYPLVESESVDRLISDVTDLLPSLPDADVKTVFSIDHVGTKEVDDALSVGIPENGRVCVGVHVAAPGLFIPEGSPVHSAASRRTTTVYQPDCKWAMLPKELIELFSLHPGRRIPVVSGYFTFQEKDLSFIGEEFRLETMDSVQNLSYAEIEAKLEGDFLTGYKKGNGHRDGGYSPERTAVDNLPYHKKEDFPHALGEAFDHLVPLARFLALQRNEGKAPFARRREFIIKVLSEKDIRIEQRPRSGIVENVVTELMIWMNSRVALQLSRAGLPAIYRAKRDIVVSETYTQRSRAGLTVNPREHSGIGAGMYCWVTSPIRRYADLINQRQLGSLIGGHLPAFTDESELLVRAKRMEFQTRTAQIHQRRMERYWTLRWMEQHAGEPFPVTLRSLDNKMFVLFDNLPIDLDLNPEETGQKEGPALFRIEQIDFYALEFKGSVLPSKME